MDVEVRSRVSTAAKRDERRVAAGLGLVHTILGAQDELEDSVQPKEIEEIPRQSTKRSVMARDDGRQRLTRPIERRDQALRDLERVET